MSEDEDRSVSNDIYNLSTHSVTYCLTARLKMSMLVVLLIVLSKMTTRTTRRFPMNPMMITRVKMTGTWTQTEIMVTTDQFRYNMMLVMEYDMMI